ALPQLEFVEIDSTDGYYKAKNIGFDRTSSEVVVFADADCMPKENWLEKIVEPFLEAQQQQIELPPVVAGRTTYHDSVLGSAISTMDFIYFKSPLQKGAVRNFYANNVAFRRDVYQKYHFEQHQKIFRGHCQLVGIELTQDGVPIHFQNTAHTIHRFPDNARELLKLRLLRGQDTVSLAPHIAEAALPSSLQWVKKLLPVNLLLIFGIRPFAGLLQINHQDMAKLSGVRYLACMLSIPLVNAVDASGALLRLLGLSPLGKVSDGELLAMSYHSNRT
ncbi:MAG: glycosyltransferase family 2 protein, partial [Leucothrix sp.]